MNDRKEVEDFWCSDCKKYVKVEPNDGYAYEVSCDCVTTFVSALEGNVSQLQLEANGWKYYPKQKEVR